MSTRDDPVGAGARTPQRAQALAREAGGEAVVGRRFQGCGHGVGSGA